LFQIALFEQLHANENINWRHDLALLKDGSNHMHDPWKKGVATKSGVCHRPDLPGSASHHHGPISRGGAPLPDGIRS
jgi:hypothetical protein